MFVLLFRTQPLLWILVCSGLLRLIVWYSLAEQPPADPDAYLQHAEILAQTGCYSGPGTGTATAFRPPFYPFLLAACLTAGIPAGMTVFLTNTLAGLVSVTLVWQLADAVTGRPQRERGDVLRNRPPSAGTHAVLAATGVAVDPLLLRYTVPAMTEVSSAAMLIAVVWVWYQAAQEYGGHDEATAGPRTGIRLPVMAGLLIGVGTLCRPVTAVVAVTLSLTLVGLAKEHRLAAVRFVGIAAAVTVATLAPWIIRNANSFGAMIPFTTHGGYTLALANNPTYYSEVIDGGASAWDGDSLRRWQQNTLQTMQTDGVRRGDEVAENAWYEEMGRQTIRRAPLTFLRAGLHRMGVLFAVVPAEQSRGTVGKLVGLWYLLLWGGCLLSLGIDFRNRDGALILWAVVPAFALVHFFFWTDTRMRAPMMPILYVLGVRGWMTVLSGRLLKSVDG